MLVLTRGPDEQVFIDGGRIVVKVVEVRAANGRGKPLNAKVKLGFEAPKDCRVDREEIHRMREAEDRHDEGR